MRNNQCGNYSSLILINYHETRLKPLSQTLREAKAFPFSDCIRLKLEYFNTKSLPARVLRALVGLMWLCLSSALLFAFRGLTLGSRWYLAFFQKITGQSVGPAAALTLPCSPCSAAMGLCAVGEGLSLPARGLLLAALPLGSHPPLVLPDNPFLAMLVFLLTEEMSYFIILSFFHFLFFSQQIHGYYILRNAIYYKCIIDISEQIQVLLLSGWPSFCFHVGCINSFQNELGH